MPELLLELFSEEIPARMQARAVDDLARLVAEALAPLSPGDMRAFHGPRRIAVAATVAAGVPESRSVERGPRNTAPEQALAGFLRKHGATRDQLMREGDHWLLQKVTPARDAALVISAALPPLLRRFPWPKSMRWGTSSLTWVRPLRRIVCLLDGDVVRFDLREGTDDGHGLRSGNETEGHRFLAPGPVAVFGLGDWETKLGERYVIVDAAERRRIIMGGVAALAGARRLRVVEDAALLDEVAGLVEWPVPLVGRIDAAFMDLPPEVMQVSMRVHQRYFALRNPDGSPAPFFAFVANIEAPDGGASIIAGNERVLRARFADAQHFWDQDRRVRLESRVPALDGIVFHAKLGSQGDRVRRLERLSVSVVTQLDAHGISITDPGSAELAARLAKADLTTGMVGEFPELQGIMGYYYARHDGIAEHIAQAIRDHYGPKSESDPLPYGPGIPVALADKLDLLAGFFALGEKPTGSGDPYALRRAALGIIRIILGHGLQLSLKELLREAFAFHRDKVPDAVATPDDVFSFIVERWRAQVRSRGERHDVLRAVFAIWQDDNLIRLRHRIYDVTRFLITEDGTSLLTAYRRAANILRIEDKKDGPHTDEPEQRRFEIDEEFNLSRMLHQVNQSVDVLLGTDAFFSAMLSMAALRAPVDAFFEHVTVNAPEPELRRNRLRLLARLRDTMNRVADFSKIEG